MALLGGSPASPEETFFIVRRFLTALTTTHPASPGASQGMQPTSPAALPVMRPVLLAIDDLQWAEPLLLDLIEHLIQWSKDVPLLVLAAARPELRDARSSLASPGSLVTEVVTLAGLDAGAATRLAANVIGAAELPAALAGRVLAASEGNPLFVGELVRMLVHDGALKRDGDRWTTAVDLTARWRVTTCRWRRTCSAARSICSTQSTRPAPISRSTGAKRCFPPATSARQRKPSPSLTGWSVKRPLLPLPRIFSAWERVGVRARVRATHVSLRLHLAPSPSPLPR
jgi:hypothetical protein